MTDHPLEIMPPWEDNPIYYSKGIHRPQEFVDAVLAFLSLGIGLTGSEYEPLSPCDAGYGLMRYRPANDTGLYDTECEAVDKHGPGVFPITVYRDENGKHFANQNRDKVLAYHFGEGS